MNSLIMSFIIRFGNIVFLANYQLYSQGPVTKLSNQASHFFDLAQDLYVSLVFWPIISYIVFWLLQSILCSFLVVEKQIVSERFLLCMLVWHNCEPNEIFIMFKGLLLRREKCLGYVSSHSGWVGLMAEWPTQLYRVLNLWPLNVF